MQKRKDVRLKGFDYSEPRYYFVTLCTENRKSILGEIKDVETTVGGDLLGAPNIGDPWSYTNNMPYIDLSDSGKVVLSNIEYIKNNVKSFSVDCFCIMPNHIHMIVIKCAPPVVGVNPLGNVSVGGDPLGAPLNNLKGDGAPEGSPPTSGIQALPQLISLFKRITNKQTGTSLWQRNYYEHVIRDDKDLYETRKYILENPLKWTLDEYYNL